MYEIEIKAYCLDKIDFERKLREQGAVFIKEKFQKDIYFNHPARDFFRTDEALRLRHVDDKMLITYKGPKKSNQSMARVEYETEIGEIDTLHSILSSLGFQELATISKTRKTFTLRDITICIDSVQDLGDFVELEKMGKNIAEIEAMLCNLGKELGLGDYIAQSYLELLSAK